MSCEILSAERLERVLSRTAGADELALLRAHLDTDCDACVERLADVDGEALLAAFAGAPINELEAQAMFARSTRRDRRSWRAPFAVAASVMLVALGTMFFRGNELRDKGAGDVPAISLSAFAGKKIDGKPAIDRALSTDDRIKPDEVVLFRYRLEAQAYVYLLIESERGVELAYAAEEASPAGERELAARGQALALDPSGMGRKISIVAMASAQPVPSNSMGSLKSVDEFCKSCGTARVSLMVERDR